MISAPNDVPWSFAASTRMSAAASPPLTRSFSSVTEAPIALRTSRMPVRVGLTPTFFRSRLLPGTTEPATSQ